MTRKSVRLLILSDLHHNLRGKQWERTGESADNTFTGPFMLHQFEGVLSERAALADHVIIAGDLTNDGAERECVPCEKILRPYGYDRLSLVPGNHDLSAMPHTNILFPRKYRNRFLRHFGRFMFPEPNPEWRFPYIKHAGDNLVIVGLNTTAELLDRYRHSLLGFSASVGEVGAAQLDALRGVLFDPSLFGKHLVVVMHHDPFVMQNPWTKLGDRKAFLRLLDKASRVRRIIVVCGHNHNGKTDLYNKNVLHIQAPAFCGRRTAGKGNFTDITVNEDLTYSVNV